MRRLQAMQGKDVGFPKRSIHHGIIWRKENAWGARFTCLKDGRRVLGKKTAGGHNGIRKEGEFA